jgi:hypothetical protein
MLYFYFNLINTLRAYTNIIGCQYETKCDYVAIGLTKRDDLTNLNKASNINFNIMSNPEKKRDIESHIP